jgi:hypothetical protein
MTYRSTEPLDGTRRLQGRVWHPHIRTRPFSLPLPPAPIPVAGYRMVPDLHLAGFARPDGYPPGRALAAARRNRR